MACSWGIRTSQWPAWGVKSGWIPRKFPYVNGYSPGGRPNLQDCASRRPEICAAGDLHCGLWSGGPGKNTSYLGADTVDWRNGRGGYGGREKPSQDRDTTYLDQIGLIYSTLASDIPRWLTTIVLYWHVSVGAGPVRTEDNNRDSIFGQSWPQSEGRGMKRSFNIHRRSSMIQRERWRRGKPGSQRVMAPGGMKKLIHMLRPRDQQINQTVSRFF